MGDSSSASYIHMVHHLIEECIVFNMTKEECMEALSKHANIKPVITSTVWKELEKENKDFFEAYEMRMRARSSSSSSTSSESVSSSNDDRIETTSKRIHYLLSNSNRHNHH